MKIRNSIIRSLYANYKGNVQFAFANVTTYNLIVADAYKVLKWKKNLQEAYGKLEEQRKTMLKEIFTEDELKDINDASKERTPEQAGKLAKFNSLFLEHLKDETEVDIKPVSFDSWHNLVSENKLNFGSIEPEYEGILFIAPEMQ